MKPVHTRATTPLVFRALLLLYPPDFRSEFGPSILQLLRDQHRDLVHETVWTRTRFYCVAVADLYLSAVRERTTERRTRGDTARYHAWAATLLIGASAANLAYDILSPKLSMGIFAWLLTVLGAALGILLFARARRLARHR